MKSITSLFSILLLMILFSMLALIFYMLEKVFVQQVIQTTNAWVDSHSIVAR